MNRKTLKNILRKILVTGIFLFSFPSFSSPFPVSIESKSAIVADYDSLEILYEKNPSQIRSIASISKLMTAMIILDTTQMETLEQKKIKITEEDLDRLKNTSSRLKVGTTLSGDTALHLSLMSSENRLTSALSRQCPNVDQPEFISLMNQKCEHLEMYSSRFEDPTGLNPGNVSNSLDVLKMVKAASSYEPIKNYTTQLHFKLNSLQYLNSNYLVRERKIKVLLSKTGYIKEAGRCLTMIVEIKGKKYIFVFLGADRNHAPMADALKIHKILEKKER